MTEVTVAELLARGLAADAAATVVVAPGPDAPVGGPDASALVAAHDAEPGRLVVGAAPPDLHLGSVAALAGVGRGWAAHRDDLLRALQHDPRDEAELRWLLWNDGVEVVPAPDAAPAPVWRTEDPLVADRIPLPRARGADVVEATVPTVTVVLHRPGGAAGIDDLHLLDTWPVTSRVPSEVLLVGAADLPATGRIRAAASLDAAVDDARGALVWFVAAGRAIDREAWARVLRRLDDERLQWARVAYRVADGVTRSERGLAAADTAAGGPVFVLARRRALVRLDGPVAARLLRLTATAPGAVVARPAVPVDAPAPVRPVPTLATLTAGIGLDLRELAADLRDRQPANAPDTPRRDEDRPSVGWIGFSGHANFGDELVLRAARHLLPTVDVRTGTEGTHGLVLGGGTLLNADGYYQRLAHRLDAPGLRRLVLGTGVVAPGPGGWSERLAGWQAFLDAGPVGVRGPHSARHLRAWADAELPDWHGQVEVLGDPALALAPSAASVDGLVVLAPVGASLVGEVDDDQERRQHDLLLAAARAARADGRPVRLLTAHPGDDRLALHLVRALGEDVEEVVVAHRDLDAGLATLAAADVVVGTRLHALVAAAAAGTTFLGLAYLPKVVDFAASVGMEDRVAPIDAWTADGLVDALRAGAGGDRHEGMLAAVDGYRSALRERTAAWVEEL